MAQSVLSIIIKTLKQGNADKDTVRGLIDLRTTLTQAGVVAGAAAAAFYAVDKALEATVGTFMALAENVRTTASSIGVSAEQASVLIQVMDDLTVSSEDLDKAVAKNGKTYDYSLQGLASMSDAYLQLGTAQEQAAFMQEHFGKNWLNWQRAMQTGGEKLIAMGEGVAQGLILDEKDLASAEVYRLGLDQVSDSVEAFKTQIGAGFVGALTGSTSEIQANTSAIFEQAHGYTYTANKMWQMTDAEKAAWAEAERMAEEQYVLEHGLGATADALGTNQEAWSEWGTSLEDAQKGFAGFFDLTMQMQGVEDKLSEGLADIADQRRDIWGQMAEVEFGSAEYDVLRGKLDDIAVAEIKMRDESTRSSQVIVFNLLAQQLAAQGDFASILTIGEAWSIITPNVAAQSRKIWTALQGPAATAAQLQTELEQIISMPSNKTFTFIIRIIGGGAVGDFDVGSGSSTNAPLCFIEGTPITLPDGGIKHIEKMQVGEMVLSRDTEGGVNFSAPIEKVFKHIAPSYLLINGFIGVTHEHPLFVAGNWKLAQDVQIGDVLMNEDGHPILVKSIEEVQKETTVYNLEVGHESHNYFAWGVLAHNKYAAGGQLSGDVAMVGEEGYELAVRDGSRWMIIPHDASAWMLKAGIVPGKGLAEGGPLGTVPSKLDPRPKRRKPRIPGDTTTSDSELSSEVITVTSNLTEEVTSLNRVAAQASASQTQAIVDSNNAVVAEVSALRQDIQSFNASQATRLSAALQEVFG